jgi:hypothetical protein
VVSGQLDVFNTEKEASGMKLVEPVTAVEIVMVSVGVVPVGSTVQLRIARTVGLADRPIFGSAPLSPEAVTVAAFQIW